MDICPDTGQPVAAALAVRWRFVPARMMFLLSLVPVVASCSEGWSSRFTQTEQTYSAQRRKIAPMVYIDAKPTRPFRTVGYFELTSPPSRDQATPQVFKAHAASTGRDLGCELVVLADLVQSSVLVPDNRLLACGNCQGPMAPQGGPYPPSTRKFYCAFYTSEG